MADEFNPVAVRGYERAGGLVLDEFLPPLRTYRGKLTIRQMTDNCPTIGAVLFAINNIFRSVEWTVDLPEELIGDEAAEEQRDYLEHTLFTDIGDPNDMDTWSSWDDFIQNALTMLPWGHAEINPVFKKRDDGRVGISEFILIAQESLYQWDIVEPSGNVKGLWQQHPYGGPMLYVPRENYLHFKASPFKGSPEGRSILRTSYKPWRRRENLQTTEAILAERGTGFPVVTCDSQILEDSKGTGPAAEAAKQTIKMLEKIPKNVKINSQSGMVLYTNNYKNQDGTDTGNARVKFEFAPVGTTNPIDIRMAIRDYDMSIARATLSQFLFNGSGETGSRAMDESQQGMFLRAINGWLETLSGVINRQLIAKMWKLNGMEDAEFMPYVSYTSLDKADLAEIGSFIRELSAAGAPIFPNEEITEYLLNLAGLPTNEMSNSDGL